MPNLRRVGQEAEDRVVEWLVDKGYTIVTRRYCSRFGEIDIIALDEEVLVFIEVKYREKDDFSPEAAIDEKKIEHLTTTAEHYMHDMAITERQARFDMIGVTPQVIRHHVDAFRCL